MSDATTSTDDCIEVLDAHRFDEASLERYMLANVDGFAAPLSVQQFQGGMSNPTFKLTDGHGVSYVLRKKPPGNLLPSAHAVEREYRVISSLANTGVPVPQTFVLCEDETVIGTAFYVMQHVIGRVFLDPSLPDLAPAERGAVYADKHRALAALHSVDYRAVGLEGFGKPGEYCARQINRWTKQYVASKTDDLPDMDSLIKWLPDNLPTDDPVCIAHGDYRLGNMIFANDAPQVIAVLDWELSTLGHPYADLAYDCLAYHVPNLFRGDIASKDLGALGIPNESEYVEAYCKARGLPEIPNWTFYVVLSLFRLAAITQGVYYRGLQGNASDPRALERRDNCQRMSKIAWGLVTQ